MLGFLTATPFGGGCWHILFSDDLVEAFLVTVRIESYFLQVTPAHLASVLRVHTDPWLVSHTVSLNLRSFPVGLMYHLLVELDSHYYFWKASNLPWPSQTLHPLRKDLLAR